MATHRRKPTRNPHARALRDPMFRKKVVLSKAEKEARTRRKGYLRRQLAADGPFLGTALAQSGQSSRLIRGVSGVRIPQAAPRQHPLMPGRQLWSMRPFEERKNRVRSLAQAP